MWKISCGNEKKLLRVLKEKLGVIFYGIEKENKMGQLGNRMKDYEGVESNRRFIPLLPVIARLDGRSFHSLTKKLPRPYCSNFSSIMIATTKYLVEETNACIGYTQSDEISLVFYSDDTKSQIFFDGRIMKMTSTLSAMCSVKFNQEWKKVMKEYPPNPTFDCRCWNVPTLEEAANAILWRELDATKNSVQMAGRSIFSHKELHKKHTRMIQEMLFQKGINWNDYPSFFKRGSFIQRRKALRAFTGEEIKNLPPKHEARINPDLKVQRTEYQLIDMPPFSKVSNRVGVIFYGEEPTVNV